MDLSSQEKVHRTDSNYRHFPLLYMQLQLSPSNWIIFFTNKSGSANFLIHSEFVLKQVACANSTLVPHSFCPSTAAHWVHCHLQKNKGPGWEHSAGTEVSERCTSQEMPSFQGTAQCPRGTHLVLQITQKLFWQLLWIYQAPMKYINRLTPDFLLHLLCYWHKPS